MSIFSAGKQLKSLSWQRRSSIGWAVILSLVSPGLGQVYARTWRRGLQILVASFGLPIVGREVTRIWQPSRISILATMVVVTGIVVFWLWAAFDAGLQARYRSNRPQARWFRSAWITMLCVTGLGLIVDKEPYVGWRSFSIPSVSMMPMLDAGDYIALKMTGAATDVERGDVVVFATPRRGDFYVKRVIAVSGDRVAVQGGQVVLNGSPLPLLQDGTTNIPVNVPGRGASILAQRFVETMPDGRHYTVAKMTSEGPANNMPEFQVRPGMLFVMGDNRDNSLDSRFAGEFREISTNDLIGRGGVIFWSRDLRRLLTPVN